MRRGLKQQRDDCAYEARIVGCTDLPDEEGTETRRCGRSGLAILFEGCTDLPDEEGTETDIAGRNTQ